MTELLSTNWLHAFGWTLLHSLWQSALVLLVIFIALKLVSSRRSTARYAIACCGLASVLLLCILTFLSQRDSSSPGGTATVNMPLFLTETEDVSIPPDENQSPGTLASITQIVSDNMGSILLLWFAGVLVFSVRFGAGLLYTWRLRQSAVTVSNEWSDFVVNAGRKFGIRRVIRLSESMAIGSPIVLGFLKPVILVPTGMFSGLTTEELETVFLHELAHIRRHDYFINLVQSLVETVLFFNPFVWALSQIIRREREYCCDDMVVRYHGSTRAYAHALVSLAEARLAFPGFALALAADKNQLLSRIKRIMEGSAYNTEKRKLVIPMLVLLASLMCVSWLGRQNNPAEKSEAVAAADTVPRAGKEKKGMASYSRRSIITLDENGQPHEEIVEEFDGDESLRPFLSDPFDAAPHMLSPFAHHGDTIPPLKGFRSPDELREMAHAMEESLMKQFGLFQEDSFLMQGFADRFKYFELPDGAFEYMDDFQHEGVFKQLEEQFKDLQDFNFDHLQDLGGMPWPSQGYEGALRDQLRKDGYLKDGEAIESLEWSNDSFKVNGKPLREGDRARYQELNKQFFSGPRKTERLE